MKCVMLCFLAVMRGAAMGQQPADRGGVVQQGREAGSVVVVWKYRVLACVAATHGNAGKPAL